MMGGLQLENTIKENSTANSFSGTLTNCTISVI